MFLIGFHFVYNQPDFVPSCLERNQHKNKKKVRKHITLVYKRRQLSRGLLIIPMIIPSHIYVHIDSEMNCNYLYFLFFTIVHTFHLLVLRDANCLPPNKSFHDTKHYNSGSKTPPYALPRVFGRIR